MDKEYTVLATAPIVVLDNMNNPVDGTLVRFTFLGNQIGEVKLTRADFLAGKAPELIKSYIERVKELSG